MISDKKITAVGGGTGLSMLLGGLRKYFHDMAAIVTVADNGGSSGKLRTQLGMLPPGDIRNCLCALANNELKDIMNYRFTEGEMKGHPLGNLCIAAMNEMSSSFGEAVEKMNRMLETDGIVIPVTNEDVNLCAFLENGDIVWGESSIGKRRTNERISHVELRPKNPEAVGEAIEKIINADAIVFGPGSLYTSIIPNLLVSGMTDAIKNSRAKKIYVCNIMTQPGETIGYSAYDHLAAIEKHTYTGIMDYIIVNDNKIDGETLKKYEIEGSQSVKADKHSFRKSRTKLICGDFVSYNDGVIRHNVDRLAKVIEDCICERI